MSKDVFAYSPTHVFWDVDDWPAPLSVTPSLISNNIKLHLRKEGYDGRMEAMAYGEVFKSMPKDLKKEYNDAGFIFYNDEVDKFGRMANMLEDILLCSWELRQGQVLNVLVLANISEELMVYVLVTLKSRGHNVVFASKSQSQEGDDSSSSLVGRLSQSGISGLTWPNLLGKKL